MPQTLVETPIFPDVVFDPISQDWRLGCGFIYKCVDVVCRKQFRESMDAFSTHIDKRGMRRAFWALKGWTFYSRPRSLFSSFLSSSTPHFISTKALIYF